MLGYKHLQPKAKQEHAPDFDLIQRFECEDSLASFTEKQWRYIDPAPFKRNWVFDAIAEHLEAVTRGHIKRLLINVPPRFGKPVTHDAFVMSLRGYVRLRDILVGDMVLTKEGRYREVTEVHEQGELDVLRITTRKGRILECAPDHPVLTTEGWVEAGKLRKDDVIGVIPTSGGGVDTISEEEARLLGYLVGDGCCRGTPNITCADDTEGADIIRCADKLGFTVTIQQYQLTKTNGLLCRYSLTAPHDLPARRKKGYRGPVLAFLDKHNLSGKTSYTKTVPNEVMQGSDKVVAAFLGAYWACDGHITSKGVKRSGVDRDDLQIGCDSVNPELMRQVQLLLQRLGIFSSIRKKTRRGFKTLAQGDEYVSYALTLNSQDNVSRFAKSIPIYHSKFSRLHVRTRRFDFDQRIYGEVVDEILPIGKKRCLCLTVDEDESFTANGVIVHNSSLVSVAWPAWTWAQQINSPTSGPVAQFVYTSYSGVFSQRDSMKTRRLVASPTYQKYWGDKVLITKDQDAKSRFETTAGGYRIATSVGGTLTGDGGNILCFPKGTRVTTPSGDLAIEDFVAGDEVVAFDISQGKVVTSTVLSTRSLLAHEFITICTSKGRSFRCTPEHRIFVPGRGYICASELVVGERLIGVSDIKEGASQDQMQPMSVSYAETLVRRSQSSETERYGSLLLDSVQEQTSFIQELKDVPRVFGGREWGSSAQLNLLQGMPSDRSGKTSKGASRTANKTMPGMFASIFKKYDLLLTAMRGRKPRPEHVRCDKLELRGRVDLQRVVSEIKSFGERARSFFLRSLLRQGKLHNRQEEASKVQSIGSSYRRGYEERLDNQPCDALCQLPQTASSWTVDFVTSIARHSCGEQPVYDIGVKGAHNFFAEGTLVHNCVDDPLNSIDAASQTELESVIRWWEESFQSRLNDQQRGAMVVIMQRLAEGDLAGHILDNDKNGDWTNLILPMRYDSTRSFPTLLNPKTGYEWEDPREEEGELLWPERFSEKTVNRLETTMGKFAFAAQYMQCPIPRGGGIVGLKDWMLYDLKMAHRLGVITDDELERGILKYPAFSYVLASVDTASTEKEINDYSAMTVWGVFQDERGTNRIMLIYAWKDRLLIHGKADDDGTLKKGLVERVADTCNQWKVNRLVVENKSSGIQVGQEIARLYKNAPWYTELFNPKGDKVARLYSVQPLFAQRLIYAPDKRWADMVIQEIQSFPKGKWRDLVDSTSQGLQSLRDTGLANNQSEQDEERETEMKNNDFREYKPPYQV